MAFRFLGGQVAVRRLPAERALPKTEHDDRRKRGKWWRLLAGGTLRHLGVLIQTGRTEWPIEALDNFMASDYLLPCTCGRTHRVSSRQAGDTVACACGASLEVPTMRELSRLEPAATGTPVRQKVWGLRQGLMFLGSVIAGGGLAAGSYFSLVAMPAPEESAASQADVDCDCRSTRP